MQPTSSSSSHQKNKQLLERFLGSIRSDVTRKGVLYYLQSYMKYHHFYEEEEKSHGQEHEPYLLNDDNDGNHNKDKKNTTLFIAMTG